MCRKLFVPLSTRRIRCAELTQTEKLIAVDISYEVHDRHIIIKTLIEPVSIASHVMPSS